MKTSDVKKLLLGAFKNKTDVPICLVGDAGIGKSEIVNQAAKESGMKCIDLRLSQMEPGDLIGIPRPDNDTKKTVWLKPDWFPNEDEQCVIFLDELNRAQVEARQCIFQLLTDWKLHTHTLNKKNMVLVAAINQSDKTQYQVDELDPAMVNRMCFIKVEAHIDDWLTWAKMNKVNDVIIKFLAVNHSLLSQPSEQGPFPSGRSWVRLSSIMSIIEPEMYYPVAVGLVGESSALAFKKFLDKEYVKPVGGKEILDDYDGVKGKLKNQSNDAMYATITDLAATLSSIVETTGSLSNSMIKNLEKITGDIGPEYIVALVKKLPQKAVTIFAANDVLGELIVKEYCQSKKSS